MPDRAADFQHERTAAGAVALSPDVPRRASLGVVAIGRNEGERLERCLRSVVGEAREVVYVDSGSSDDSVAVGRALGVRVVELDMSRPFTAARARNAGFRKLREIAPDLEYVQFIDGDCEIVPGWFDRALDHLASHPIVGATLGRRHERYPDATIYNRLCDLEWNPPVGETPYAGGDCVMRVKAFEEAGYFDATMIAGEEPELSIRLRDCGWRIDMLDADMTRHDVAMTRFAQWWRRSERAGHAYAEGAAMHGETRWRHQIRPVQRIHLWGVLLPLAWILTLVASPLWPAAWWGVRLLPLAYAWLGVRVYRHLRRRGDARRHAALYAVFTIIGRVPETIGLLSYWTHRIRGRRRGLIEYK